MQGPTVAGLLHPSFMWLRWAVAGQQCEQMATGPTLFYMRSLICLLAAPNYTVGSWVATFLVVLYIGKGLGIKPALPRLSVSLFPRLGLKEINSC